MLRPVGEPHTIAAALAAGAPAEAADVYASLGWPVVPMYEPAESGGCACPAGRACSDPGKHPQVAGGVHAATCDPAVVRGWWRRWPEASIGLACGVWFDVLDVDGDQGLEALRAILSQAGEVPAGGPLARTGGGWHLLVRPTGLGNRVRFAAGLDWRGRGGMVVAPPSRHVSGVCYRWLRPPRAELPAVPAALARLLAPPRPAPHPPAPVRRRAGYGAAALAGEAAKVRACASDSNRRQATLNVAAFKLGRLVAAGLLAEAEVWAELTSAAAATGLGEWEVAKTIRRALADAAAQAHPPAGGERR
jgi:bifunctional DNA primase/polymerase-like protein